MKNKSEIYDRLKTAAELKQIRDNLENDTKTRVNAGINNVKERQKAINKAFPKPKEL